ncbi:MAG: membrane dipeptidase [Deltaproteobacteria bacterium]|nr:membrane dipeptidase [Deltaproteobacteria bacterium]
MEGFESPSEFSSVTEGLLAMGYSPEEVKKIMGGNWLRFYETVWQGI